MKAQHHHVPTTPRFTTACVASYRLYHVQVVSPGQNLFKLPLAGAVRVGPGLQVEGDCLITTKSGILRKTKAGKFWVEGRPKGDAGRWCEPAASSALLVGSHCGWLEQPFPPAALALPGVGHVQAGLSRIIGHGVAHLRKG